MKNFLKKNKISFFFANLFRTLFYPLYFIVSRRFDFTIKTPDKTAIILSEKGKSFARFGDGEFKIIFKKKSIGFQRYSDEVRKRLISVFFNKNIEIGLPYALKSTKSNKFNVKVFWWTYAFLNYKNIKKIVNLSKRREFLDTNFGRTMTELNSKSRSRQILNNIKEIWKSKNIILIEGKYTRFGVNNDLLKDAKSVTRILAPAVNAFEKVDLIEQYMIKLVKSRNKENTIVLVALGPTATVLASELSSYVQTIDIGHLDLQYELSKGKRNKTQIATRFNNEKLNGEKVQNVVNHQYISEILKDFSE